MLEQLSEVRVPIAILGAEFDHITPAEVLKQWEEVLIAKTEVGISPMMLKLTF